MDDSVYTLTWLEAPEWAQWFAFDEDGYAFWYQHKPDLCNDCFTGVGKTEMALNTTKVRATWAASLTQKPS